MNFQRFLINMNFQRFLRTLVMILHLKWFSTRFRKLEKNFCNLKISALQTNYGN